MALTATQAVDQAKTQLSNLIERKPSGVIAVSKDEEGWHVSLEMLERKAIPEHMDLLARYDVLLDEEGNMMKFDRGNFRTRSETTKLMEEV
jgi:hypothetical protein